MKTQAIEHPRWDFDSIPHEMKALKQWNLCYLIGQKDHQGNEVTTKKRPIGGPKNPFAFKTLDEIKTQILPGQYFGFCITPEDDIAVLDIDDDLPENFTIKDLPPRIQLLMEMQPSYSEISPSRQGLHLVYSTNKELLAHRKDQDKSTKGFEGSVFLRHQFVTVTGHRFQADSKTSKTSKTLKRIDAALFEDLTLASAKVKTISSAPNQKGLTVPQYTLHDISRWLSKIPPNITESTLQPLLNRAYASFDPPVEHTDNYDHWMNIAFAVHFAADALGQTDEGEDLFWEWSSSATNDGEQNTRQKYRDCAPKHDGHDLTYLTLVRLAASIKPVWPYPIIKYPPNKEPVVTDQPDTTNLLNWECLLELYDINLRQNEITKDYSVTALSQIQSRYFKEGYQEKSGLESDLHYFVQANSMEKASAPQANSATKWWVNQGAEQYNPIKEWIDLAPPLDPKEGSWFQALWETIELYEHDIPNEALYRSYMKKNLMGVIRAHYYTGQYSTTTGIVILQGAESTRKSTWVTQLLPQSLQEYVFPSQAELSKNAKEISLEAGVCQIWLKDEVEAFISGNKFMKNADGALKSFLVQSHDAYRPLFGTKPIQAKRKCIFFGTTNEQELELSSTGNRRIQIIPIKFCDTSAQADIDMVKVYQELLEEFKKTPAREQPNLWKLSAEEESLTDEINYSERKLESGGDTLIHDVYDFSAPFSIEPYSSKLGTLVYAKLHRVKDIATLIYERTGEKPSAAALKHILKRQVGKWSGTTKQFQTYGNWSVEYGMAKYRSKGKVKQSGYLMPPVIDPTVPFEKEMT